MARLDVVHGRQAAAPQAMSLERCRAVNLKNQEKFLDFTFYLCPNPRSVSAAGNGVAIHVQFVLARMGVHVAANRVDANILAIGLPI